MARILIVEDEVAISWTLREYFTDEGHDCLTSATAEDALTLAAGETIHLILLDVRLPGIDGISAIPALRKCTGNIPIIVMTAFGDLDTAVRAVRQGADNYLVKPFDLEEVSAVVNQALFNCNSADTPPAHPEHIEIESGRIIGHSPELQRLFRKIALVSASDLPVMITGESGTGKELVANAIHRHSNRSKQPFIAISLAAFNPNLLESELFGHVRGAFTGADREKLGLFQLAAGGTVFLDEIGDVSTEIQVKLLRVIETGEMTPVGSTKPLKTNVRLIAATNQELLSLIRQGKFREDFYFRLNVFPIELPPLRHRREDIPEIVQYFLQNLGGSITREALEELQQRDWPGNIRELRNAVEHASVLAGNQPIQPVHLPNLAFEKTEPAPEPATLEEVLSRWLEIQLNSDQTTNLYQTFLNRLEPVLLRQVLLKYHGQKQPAARALGIHRATLRQMLRKYQMDDETKPD